MKGSQHCLPNWLEVLRLWSTETTFWCKISDFLWGFFRISWKKSTGKQLQEQMKSIALVSAA